ncbi:MAG: stationary phase survival protein SurE [Candidatus Pedobacter colombiensis]|uniref:Stationary phase survival protein SurE n=1 Tax=Candidatus Pedobacter colombiensis TaxID=3121371 RepID=A0AAJ6B5C6_9SPHI|nr:stationary phase survival protein SurE [Pedobacter sp.]WEK18602.1 MAG: stationary phase survival protein SurE [Pedobacter sp.]
MTLGNRLAQIKNSVFIGLGIGLVIPGILLSGVWYLMHRFAFLAKADLLLIGCIAVNAVFMHYFFKLNKDNIGRGIISATFLWAFAFFFYKITQS